MEFIDHTGHIFSLDEYFSYPIGYDYNENPYVFWISDDYTAQLSVDCIYMKPIRVLLHENAEELIVEIKNSNNFKLLTQEKINELLSIDNPFQELELNFYTDEAERYIKEETEKNHEDIEYKNDFSNLISLKPENNFIKVFYRNYFWEDNKGAKHIILDESLLIKGEEETRNFGFSKTVDNFYVWLDENNEPCEEPAIITEKYKKVIVGYTETNYQLATFYVLGMVKESGAWLTNILLTAKDSSNVNFPNIYCPITVGGTFVDEQEELVINAQNIGLSLPKDICRAFYQTSFWNETPNMSLWNQKIKEYLLNYMKLNCERGNFQSAIQALKWFGYGKRIQLNSLIQTDNNVVNQYILDNFDLNHDIINEYRYFRRSTLLSLSIPAKIESDKYNDINFNNYFWGEGKPQLEDLFGKEIIVHYDEGDIDFRRSYYDWTLNELALKLCALKYYYQKYFLPIHLYVHRASITNQCFANDIKLISSGSTMITEKNVYAINNKTTVKFPESKICWLSYSDRIVDENWIEDLHISSEFMQNSDQQFFDISDNIFNVTISFINKRFNKDKYSFFNCVLYAYQNDKLMKESRFNLSSNEEKYDINFIIYPKYLNKNFDINFWRDKTYKILLLCNGVWYEYNFNIDVPELDIELGRLRYKYSSEVCRQFTGFNGNVPDFNFGIWEPDLINVNNINFIDELIHYMKEEHIGRVKLDHASNIYAGDIYYYYYNDEGKKVILSSNNDYDLIYDNINDEYILQLNSNKKAELKNDNEIKNIIVNKESEIKSPIYSSVYKNIYSFVDLYSIEYGIPKNLRYYNKIHLFDIYKNDNGNNVKLKYDYTEQGEQEITINSRILNESNQLVYGNLRFGNNDSAFVKELYSDFFDNCGVWNKKLSYYDEETKTTLPTSFEQQNFDLYIMHDYEYWYALMISKRTIKDSEEDLNNIKKFYTSENYSLYLNRSDEKMLINRMEFVSSNGVNNFNPDDMIVSRLSNKGEQDFSNIPFKLNLGSKWKYIPLSVVAKSEDEFDSITNIGIFSIGDNNESNRGYYAVKVNYSIDNFANEQEERSTKMLIDNKFDRLYNIYDYSIKSNNPLPPLT